MSQEIPEVHAGQGTLFGVTVTARRTELVYERPDGAGLTDADYDRIYALLDAARTGGAAA